MKLHGQCYNVVTCHKLNTYFFSLGKSNGNKRESLNNKDGKTTVFIDTHSYVPISSFFLLSYRNFNYFVDKWLHIEVGRALIFHKRG